MKYTEEDKVTEIIKICRLLTKEELSLRTILKRKDTISRHTFYEWIKKYPVLNEHYTRAQLIKSDIHADKSLEIADDNTQDFYKDKDGVQRPNAVAVQRARLQFDVRKWKASVEAPRKYGKSLDVTTGGEKFDVVPIVIKIDGSDIEDKMKM